MEYVHVGRFEITTEFRRVVRLEEKHALLNDAFGRGGLRDVEEALRPPDASIRPLEVVQRAFHGGDDVVGRALTGGFVEAAFDSGSIGHRLHRVREECDGRPLGVVTIDFDTLK